MMPDISWGIKILELINKPHIYWCLGITSSLMLFLPDKVLSQLGLLIIIDELNCTPKIGHNFGRCNSFLSLFRYDIIYIKVRHKWFGRQTSLLEFNVEETV